MPWARTQPGCDCAHLLLFLTPFTVGQGTLPRLPVKGAGVAPQKPCLSSSQAATCEVPWHVFSEAAPAPFAGSHLQTPQAWLRGVVTCNVMTLHGVKVSRMPSLMSQSVLAMPLGLSFRICELCVRGGNIVGSAHAICTQMSACYCIGTSFSRQPHKSK